MSESFMHHERILFERGSHESTSEGICGKDCIVVKGTTEKVKVTVAGIDKLLEVSFTVIPDRHRIGFPIFGQNLFEQIKVGFGKEEGKMFTYIEP